MTDVPYGSLSSARYHEHIRADAAKLAGTVRTCQQDVRVPTCPEWSVRDLVDHLGVVHRWAELIVSSDSEERIDRSLLAGVGEEVDLAGWYDERVGDLLTVLARTDPEKPCWSHQKGRRVAAYWSRRQAHETAVHRADVELAAGGEPGYDAELAVDGIGEVLDVWMPVVRSFAKQPPALPAQLLLACTDRSERWLIGPNGDRGPLVTGPAAGTTSPAPITAADRSAGSAAAISGRAADLMLLLWRRVDRARVVVEGDAAVADAFLGSRLTP
jgi:uncharacterized protein (TIGR03083 family)